MSHSIFGCSSVVKAVVLQGMLAEAGIYGRIERALHGYAVKVTHEDPLKPPHTVGLCECKQCSTVTRPRLVWSSPQ